MVSVLSTTLKNQPSRVRIGRVHGRVGRRIRAGSLSSRVGLLLASLLELEKELLNLLATCVGETLVLADNPEPTFF